MHTVSAILVVIAFLSLAGGCSRAVSPLATEQEKFFAQVGAPNPTAERALRYARYYSLAGRQDLAKAELERALQQDPQNIRLLNALGNLCDQLGDYRQAQENYKKILAQDADNPLAWNNLGYSHYLAGDLAQAEKILQELLAKHPDNTVGRNNLGLVWCRQGKQQEALALWEKKDGPEAAQVKLQQVMAFLSRAHSGGSAGSAPIPVAAAPRPAAPAATASLQEKAPEPEPAAPTATMAPSTLPARTLTAPPVAQKNLSKPDANEARPETPAGPQVKVEEVAMIIQPASYNPAPVAPKYPQKPLAAATPPAGSPEPLALSTGAELQDSKPGRRSSRFRMITVPSLDLPKTVKPLREYITRPHSHQGLNPPAMPELAVY